MDEIFKQDVSFILEVLSKFIAGEVLKYHFQGGVVALSGGLDSSVVAILSYKALQGKIKLLYMPHENPEGSLQDALSVAKLLSIPLEIFDLKQIANNFFSQRNPLSPLRKGNILARLRMTALFDTSSRDQSLVIGCSNKTEILVGYSTWFGDTAAGILPIGDLYKTQVRNLAIHLSVPNNIIQKPPSAELWNGQTDEGELGISYSEMDQILYRFVDQRMNIQEIIKIGFDENNVRKVIALTKKALYKQKMPLICKVSDRTVGLDYRYLKETSIQVE